MKIATASNTLTSDELDEDDDEAEKKLKMKHLAE